MAKLVARMEKAADTITKGAHSSSASGTAPKSTGPTASVASGKLKRQAGEDAKVKVAAEVEKLNAAEAKAADKKDKKKKKEKEPAEKKTKPKAETVAVPGPTGPDNSSLWVGNLNSKDSTPAALKEAITAAFSPFGEIKKIEMKTRTRFAFLYFTDEVADKIISAHEKKAIVVNDAEVKLAVRDHQSSPRASADTTTAAEGALAADHAAEAGAAADKKDKDKRKGYSADKKEKKDAVSSSDSVNTQQTNDADECE